MRIYLDWNAAAPLRPEARAAMLEALAEPGNASSPHREGQRARVRVEEARAAVAALVGAAARELTFTASATEALNLAVVGLARARRGEGRINLVVSAVEHAAVLEPVRALTGEGFEVREAPVDSDGRVDLAALERLVDTTTALVAVMQANNETGAIQDVSGAARIARACGASLLVDAAQSAGRIPVCRDDLGADLLALSSVKLGGPAGGGALVVRRGLAIEPILRGGPHERGLRAGTEAVSILAGFGAAAAAAHAQLEREATAAAALRARLEAGLARLRPDARFNAAPGPRTPNTSSVSLAGVDGEALVLQLDLEGVACSTGSACASGAALPSHVLLAMGRSEAEARATLRFSLGHATTAAEIDAALARLGRALAAQTAHGVSVEAAP